MTDDRIVTEADVVTKLSHRPVPDTVAKLTAMIRAPAIWASIAAGLVLQVVFFTVERRTASPLINVRIFENRAFLVENIILGVAMMAFHGAPGSPDSTRIGVATGTGGSPKTSSPPG